MADYKELFDAAKVKLDSEISKEKIIAKQEAEEFFETNKKCLVDGFLNYTIKKWRDVYLLSLHELLLLIKILRLKAMCIEQNSKTYCLD